MADIILEATSTELNYSAGVTGPIQVQIDNLKNVLAIVESEFVASKKYTPGEYFIYGESLYVVIAEVPSGDAFVAGTNVNSIGSNGVLNSLMSKKTRKKWDAILTGSPIPDEEGEDEEDEPVDPTTP